MENMQPLVHAAINGTDALFVADSGASFSYLGSAAAKRFNLHLEPLPSNEVVMRVSGEAAASITTVKTFTIFHQDAHNQQFIVTNLELHHGAVGVIGQNVFRLGDVEFDLAHGVIRILRPHGDCRNASLAYWANDKGLPYSSIDIDPATKEQPLTTGRAYVNGSRIIFVLDSGANVSRLTLAAARHAGVTPNSPGVTPAGAGPHGIRTWIAPFASFRIGDEEIRNTHLRIGDARASSVDMLLGADFLLSHRVYVANSQRKLYFTYNGGPVFNLTTMPEPTSGGSR
jgi:predicted aspartyl protease